MGVLVKTKCLNEKCGITKMVLNGRGKYCSIKCQQQHIRDTTKRKLWESGKLSAKAQANRKMVLYFLMERDGRKCNCCKLSMWNNKEIPLDIDHIDGNNENNNAENHRLLCPNCHRQTHTWGNSTHQRKNKKRSLGM